MLHKVKADFLSDFGFLVLTIINLLRSLGGRVWQISPNRCVARRAFLPENHEIFLGKHLVKRELTDVSNCFELFRPLTRGRYANLNDNHLGLRIPNHPKQPLFQTALYFSLGLELDPQKIWINFCSQAGKRQWHPRPRSISLSSPGALLLPVPGTQISHRSDVFCTPRWSLPKEITTVDVCHWYSLFGWIISEIRMIRIRKKIWTDMDGLSEILLP